MPEVRFPNGDAIHFPEGVEQAEIDRVSNEHWLKVQTGGGELVADTQESKPIRVDDHQIAAPSRPEVKASEAPAASALPEQARVQVHLRPRPKRRLQESLRARL